MSDQIKKLAPLIWSEIQKANKILLNIHVTADLDSIGSALGLKQILENLGKQVTVISPESIANEKAQHAEKMLGFKDILYKEITDLDLSNYDLFICLDIGQPSRISRNHKLTFPLSIPTIVIDHHKDNSQFGEINFIEGLGHCTSELLYWLCMEWKINISPETAKCFFMGILSDTDRFRFEGVTSSDTFRAASDLIEIGNINFPELMWENQSKGNKFLKAYGYFLGQCHEVFGGKVLLSTITFADLRKFDLEESSMKTIYRIVSDTLSDSETSYITAVIYQLNPTLWGLSIRTDNPHHFDRDSSLIARQFPGGGGHVHGAGATMTGEFAEVEKTLLDNIQKVYPDLGQP